MSTELWISTKRHSNNPEVWEEWIFFEVLVLWMMNQMLSCPATQKYFSTFFLLMLCTRETYSSQKIVVVWRQGMCVTLHCKHIFAFRNIRNIRWRHGVEENLFSIQSCTFKIAHRTLRPFVLCTTDAFVQCLVNFNPCDTFFAPNLIFDRNVLSAFKVFFPPDQYRKIYCNSSFTHNILTELLFEVVQQSYMKWMKRHQTSYHGCLWLFTENL